MPVKVIYIPTPKGDIRIVRGTVILVKASQPYSLIYTAVGKFLCLLPLKKVLQQLKSANCFHKVHRSFYVNMDKIILRFKESKTLFLLMSDLSEVQVAKRKKTKFRDHFIRRIRCLQRKKKLKKINCFLKCGEEIYKNDSLLHKCIEALHSGKCPLTK